MSLRTDTTTTTTTTPDLPPTTRERELDVLGGDDPNDNSRSGDAERRQQQQRQQRRRDDEFDDDFADDEEDGDSYGDDSSDGDDDDDLVDDLSVYDEQDESATLSLFADDDVVAAADRVIRLRVKSFRDCSVAVKGTTTISELKQVVVKALGKQAEGRYIRLICKGRLLAPDSASLGRDFAATVKSGDVIHAVLAAAGQRGGPQAAFARGAGAAGAAAAADGTGGGGGMSRRMFRGVGIDASGAAVRPDADDEDFTSESDYEDEEVGSGGGRPRERLGFDRLRGGRGPDGGGSFMGLALRRAEVSAIRTYFSRHVDRWIQRNPATAEAAAGTETDLVRRRHLQEDAWMQAQGPASEFRLNLAGAAWQQQQQQQQPQLVFGRAPNTTTTRGSPNDAVWRTGMSSSIGTDRDFMWGFMLGFFVGFMTLIWVWLPQVTHKQKLGILTGISAQLALNMIKTEEGGDNDDNTLLEGN